MAETLNNRETLSSIRGKLNVMVGEVNSLVTSQSLDNGSLLQLEATQSLLVTSQSILQGSLTNVSSSVSSIVIPQHNESSIISPQVTDDADAGYGFGSLWVSGSAVFLCTDASVGNANWILIGPNS